MSQWEELPVVSHRPSQRGGHASVVIPLYSSTTDLSKVEKTEKENASDCALIVVGGADAFGAAYNEVLLFELPLPTDHRNTSTTSPPSPRSARCVVLQPQSSSCGFTARMGHSAQVVNDAGLVKRMTEAESTFPSFGASMVEKIEETTTTTTSISSGNTEKSTEGNTLPSSRQQRFSPPIVLFGGMCTATQEEAVFNDVWLLFIDLDYNSIIETFSAKKIRTTSTPLVKWVKLGGCTGDVPPPRHSHASTILGDEMMIVGGSDGNQPLDDGYALNLVTRVWRRVDLRLPILASSTSVSSVAVVSSSSSTAASSSLQAFGAREMSSMCVHPRLGGGHVALLTGGRDSDGLMLGDAVALTSFSSTGASAENNEVSSSTISAASQLTSLSPVFDNVKFRRCCHTVVPSVHNKLGPVFLCVGGFTPEGMPLEDLLVSLTMGKECVSKVGPIAVPRKLKAKLGTELHFGLGHSAASASTKKVGSEDNEANEKQETQMLPFFPLRTFVVSGIVPNTIGASMAVYELAMDSEGASLTPLPAAPACETASTATAHSNMSEGTTVAGLL